MLIGRKLLQKSTAKSFNQIINESQKRLTPIAVRGISNYNNIIQMDELQQSMKDMARNFWKEEIEPHAAKFDKEDKFDPALWKKMGDQGLLGITAPEEYGGTGLGYFEHCLVSEEISRASGGVGLSYIAHANLCINQIKLNGTEAQKKKYLPKLCSGEFIGALAMSEPGSGSDVTSMKTTAKKEGSKYIINGSKMWITNGPSANVVLVYAKTDTSAGHKGISAFLVDTDTPGFSVTKKLDKFGMRGSETGQLFFENVEVPAENLVNEEGKGVYVLMSGLDFERLLLSSGCVGIMQKCMDVTMPYVVDRKQFGKSIGEFQIMQAKIADMYTKLQASRAFMYSCARMADSGIRNNKDCASLFLFCSKAGVDVALECMQAFGGNGYINEYDCGRLLRDAKLYDIGGGTTEIRQWLIGRELMKEYS
jgi:isovaleryl-CoA dehydrogenase